MTKQKLICIGHPLWSQLTTKLFFRNWGCVPANFTNYWAIIYMKVSFRIKSLWDNQQACDYHLMLQNVWFHIAKHHWTAKELSSFSEFPDAMRCQLLEVCCLTRSSFCYHLWKISVGVSLGANLQISVQSTPLVTPQGIQNSEYISFCVQS